MTGSHKLRTSLLSLLGIGVYMFLAFATAPEKELLSYNGNLQYLKTYSSEAELKAMYEHYQLPVLVIQNHIYLTNSACAEKRELAGAAEERSFGSATENRDILGDQENERVHGGDVESRDVEGDLEKDHDLAGDAEERNMQGDLESDRRLEGDDEIRDLEGGQEDDRNLGEDTEVRNLGDETETRDLEGDAEGDRSIDGGSEDRSYGGLTEERSLSSDFEERKLSGNTREIYCVKVNDKAAFKLQGHNPNARILVYDLNGLREVRGEIIEYY